MKLSDFRTNNTPYQNLIFQRYSNSVLEYPSTSEEYSIKGVFTFVLEAPYFFGVEDEMMDYALNHPNATVFELDNYFGEIVPPQSFKVSEE